MEGLYFQCSENKGADQLRGYREADLRLCFRICKNLVFSQRGSDVTEYGFTCSLFTYWSGLREITLNLDMQYRVKIPNARGATKAV